MKLNKNSIGIKLWKYFAVFSIIIIAMLWILQTVLLQGFYNFMQTRHIKRIANDIVSNYNSENIRDMIDYLASDNSLLILITDNQKNVLYSADEYRSSYSGYDMGMGENKNPYRKQNAQTNGNPYRNLPKHYDEFIERLNDDSVNEVCYQLENSYNENATLVYGRTIQSENGDVILYINTTLGAVGSTVYILRLMLCVVTFAALVIAFLIALFISKRFEKPIKTLSEQASCMASSDFDIIFDKGFCAELDDLASTLDKTANKLSVNDKLRRDLLANVSHDLRTPLTMIKGYAELVRDVSGEDKETAQQYITADMQRIEQVLYNLISNAVAHIGKNKRVFVSVKGIENAVRVEVRDNGKGISEEELPHIWDRYFTNKKRLHNGTGLGLSIVKEILTAHNAKFGIDSVVGQGSIFWFEIKSN